MTEQNCRGEFTFEHIRSNSFIEDLPPEAKNWAESLPWEQRRHVLLLCHLLCVSPPEKQADFLDNYTADGLVSRKFEDTDAQRRIQENLQHFHLKINLDEFVFRLYIKQFYIHSSKHINRQPDLYFQLVFRLLIDREQENNIFYYILGFEQLKMMFTMSWLQHERLYQLQKNQDSFIKSYIKPIQIAHELNGIIVPEGRNNFFARRGFFVKKPRIKARKLVELVMATFTTDVVISLGFSMMRDRNSLKFDYDYIFQPEPKGIFPE